jgi:hypothetical protein
MPDPLSTNFKLLIFSVFQYIQKLVSTEKVPQLVLASKDELLESFPPLILNMSKIKPIDTSLNGSPSMKHKNDPVLLWKVPNHYSVSIKSISNVSSPDNTKVRDI